MKFFLAFLLYGAAVSVGLRSRRARTIAASTPYPYCTAALFDWRLRERNRLTQHLRQDLRRLRHRSHVTAEIDLAAVQGGGLGERPRAKPTNVVYRNHL